MHSKDLWMRINGKALGVLNVTLVLETNVNNRINNINHKNKKITLFGGVKTLTEYCNKYRPLQLTILSSRKVQCVFYKIMRRTIGLQSIRCYKTI